MGLIRFKKNCSEKLIVNDIVNKFEIAHLYFNFNEEDFPFDSRVLARYLLDRRISVVSIDKDVKAKSFFTSYLIQDNNLQKIEKEKEKKKIEDDEKAKLKRKEEAKKKLLEDKKKEKEELKKEEKRKKNIKLIDQTNIGQLVNI